MIFWKIKFYENNMEMKTYYQTGIIQNRRAQWH